MHAIFTWPFLLLEESKALRLLISELMKRMQFEFSEMDARLTQMEKTMSAATDALNAAVSDLAKASEAVLAKISEETAKIDDLLKGDDTPDVDAATARIRQMTSELTDKLGALNTSASAVAQDAANPAGPGATPAAATPATDTPVTDGGAGPELAGVPATPGGADVAASGPAVPSSDFIVTETSPNQDTSGPGAAARDEVGPAAPAPESAPDNASAKKAGK